MTSPPVDIPARAWFKASEVCEIAELQAFILRSWEKEFPDLGVAKTPGGPRLYRKADVERVLQIKDLLFTEGLTLAGARRRLEQHIAPPPEPEPEADVLVTDDLRDRLGKVKEGLSGLLTMLGESAVAEAGEETSRGAGAAIEDSQPFLLTEAAAEATPSRAAPTRTPPPPPARTVRPPASRRRRA